MIIILSLLCGLITAATSGATLDPYTERPYSKPIPQHTFSLASDVLQSIEQLTTTAYTDDQPNLGKQLSQTLHSLLVTHETKMRLFYMLDGQLQHTPDLLEAIQKYAKEIATPLTTHDPSKLHQQIAEFLKENIIDQEPPFAVESHLELLRTPDTRPVSNLIATFPPFVVGTPSIAKPLDILTHTNWEQLFNSLVSSGYSTVHNRTWSYCAAVLKNDMLTRNETPQSWEVIDTNGLCTSDKILASIVNLAHAHFVHASPNLSEEIIQALHPILVTHGEKMCLSYMLDNNFPKDSTVLTDIQTYAKSIASVPLTYTTSKLQKQTSEFLRQKVINKEPPFALGTNITLLNTPDVDSVINLLTSHLPTASTFPCLQGPLETLLNLDWYWGINSLVSSGMTACDCAGETSIGTWSYCAAAPMRIISLLKAKTLEELTAEYADIHKLVLGVNLAPVLIFKQNMLSGSQ